MDGIPDVPMLEGVLNASRITLTEKRCTKCGEIKSLNEFFIKKYKRYEPKRRYPKKCKDCNLKGRLKHRNMWLSIPGNREIQKKHNANFYKKNKEYWMQILNKLDLIHCSVCGYNRSFCAIDLHHINPGQKETPSGKIFSSKPTERTLKELKKCISLCSNCHRELHEKIRKEEEDGRE